jgi:hypothetical protein
MPHKLIVKDIPAGHGQYPPRFLKEPLSLGSAPPEKDPDLLFTPPIAPLGTGGPGTGD